MSSGSVAGVLLQRTWGQRVGSEVLLGVLKLPIALAATTRDRCSSERCDTRWDGSRGVTEIVFLVWFDPAHQADTKNLVILVYSGLDKPKYVHNWNTATKLNQPFL